MSGVRVYVATCLERREEAARVAQRLRAAGAAVVSTWQDRADSTRAADLSLTTRERGEVSARLRRELDQTDLMVWLLDARCRNAIWEAGYAVARGAVLLAVGDRADFPTAGYHAVWFADAVDELVALVAAQPLELAHYAARRRGPGSES